MKAYLRVKELQRICREAKNRAEAEKLAGDDVEVVRALKEYRELPD